MALNIMTTVVVLAAIFESTMGGIVPAAPLVSAPLVAPAAIGYAKAVPQNIPPFASRVDINSRVLAAPFIAAPAAYSSPLVSAPLAPAAYSPYIAAPTGIIDTTYAGSLAAPLAQYSAAAYGPAVLG